MEKSKNLIVADFSRLIQMFKPCIVLNFNYFHRNQKFQLGNLSCGYFLKQKAKVKRRNHTRHMFDRNATSKLF